MLCMARLLLFFSRGGFTPALRAVLRAIAHTFKATSSSRKRQPSGAACTPLATANASPDEVRAATQVAIEEPVKPDANNNGDDTKSSPTSGVAIHSKLLEATVTHPAEAPAVYSFLCMLDIADLRLRRALADKAKLKAEVEELQRRAKPVDEANAERAKQLEDQLKESRDREKDLRGLLRAQAAASTQRNADMRLKLDSLELQYNWLLKASSRSSSELRAKTLRLELRVADLEADLKEARAQPNADVVFLLSRCGELELALEAAYTRLSKQAAVFHKRPVVGC